MGRNDRVTITVKFLHHTDKATLVQDGDGKEI